MWVLFPTRYSCDAAPGSPTCGTELRDDQIKVSRRIWMQVKAQTAASGLLKKTFHGGAQSSADNFSRRTEPFRDWQV